MKKLFFLIVISLFFVSCSDDNEIFELQGSWPWKIDMEDGTCYTCIPFVAGEENIKPVLYASNHVRTVSYHLVGAFGGIPIAEKITCKLIFRKNDEPKKIIDEIYVENETSINFNFQGIINEESYQDLDEIYLCLQLIVTNQTGSQPPMIGYSYDFGSFSTSGEIEP